jgi:hypothetical protein
MLRRYRRALAALALLAVLLNAFVPTVARALAPLALGEICSAADGERGLPLSALAQKHCPYCAPHAGSFGAPPPAGLSLPPPAARPLAALADTSLWPAAAPAFPAQPRAPPFCV